MKMNLILLAVVGMSFMSCKEITEKTNESIVVDSTNVPSDGHNAMMSLDYQGTYKGSLPCADCEAIETTLVLAESTYTKETIYKGKSKEIFKETGKYTWNEAGNTIQLLNSEASDLYFVGENVLFHLDSDGKRIEGDLATKYELKKETNQIVDAPKNATNISDKVDLKNSKWRLVKLNGKAITKNEDDKRDLGIIFNTDGRFSAYAGCNNMMGSYKLKDKESRITFSKVAMTMMACPDSELEKEFAEVLELADNYNFDGKTLKLNKARMAPIAEFEIIK